MYAIKGRAITSVLCNLHNTLIHSVWAKQRLSALHRRSKRYIACFPHIAAQRLGITIMADEVVWGIGTG